MTPASPEKYAKALTIRISEGEFKRLKELAAEEQRTIKALVLIALDKSYPNWRKEK